MHMKKSSIEATIMLNVDVLCTRIGHILQKLRVLRILAANIDLQLNAI